MLKKCLMFICILVFLMGAMLPVNLVNASGTTYYVDSVNGDDNNNGTGQSTAWKTLNKVNQTTFQPGDSILFKRGCIWNGQLHPLGSGTSENVITIGSYGTGSKPVINGGGASFAAVYLQDQEYWEITNLEVTNPTAADAQRAGIYVANSTSGVLNHIRISDCYVHDINGYSAGFYGKQGGIIVVADPNTTTRWNDVVIENNTTFKCDREGIYVGASIHHNDMDTSWDVFSDTYARSTNVIIRNNVIDESGGDGIVFWMSNGMQVRNNLVKNSGMRANTDPADPDSDNNQACVGIWGGGVDDLIVENNEVYGFGLNSGDGQAFDFDADNVRCTYQYNYSHDNYGGLMLVCVSDAGNRSDADVMRYNISQNDYAFLTFPNQRPTIQSNKLQAYNNTCYVDPTRDYWLTGGVLVNGVMYVRNNIFYINGTLKNSINIGPVYDYNVFYGNGDLSAQPDDVHKLTSDPLLFNPGSGRNGMDTVDGYKLRTGSPCLASGVLISNNGGKDYWGNTVSASSNPNRGAYAGDGITGTPVYAAPSILNPGFENRSSEWETRGTFAEDCTNQRSGNFCARITGQGAVEQIIKGLEPDTMYRVEAYIKVSNASQRAYLGVKSVQGPETKVGTNNTDYTKLSVEFVTGPDNKTVKIYVNPEVAGSTNTYIDDFTISKIDTVPSFSTGYYRFVNKNSGQVMGVSGGSHANGAQIIQWPLSSSAWDQQWQLVNLGGPFFKLVNRNSSKVIGVSGGSQSDGANCIQWTFDAGTYDQQWLIVDVGGGYYKFVNRNSGRVAGVENESTSNGAEIIQWYYQMESDGQKWSIEPVQ